MPGPVTGTVPDRTCSALSCSAAAAWAAASCWFDVCRVWSCNFSVPIWSRKLASEVVRFDRMRARSPSLSACSRRLKRSVLPSCATSMKPSAPASTTMSTDVALTRTRKRDTRAGTAATALSPEHPAPDGGQVLEDADAEHHHDRRRQIDAELVANPYQSHGQQGVGDKGDDEDAVVECALQVGAHAAERGIDGCHHGHGDIAAGFGRDTGPQHQRHDGPDQQTEHGRHVDSAPHRLGIVDRYLAGGERGNGGVVGVAGAEAE